MWSLRPAYEFVNSPRRQRRYLQKEIEHQKCPWCSHLSTGLHGGSPSPHSWADEPEFSDVCVLVSPPTAIDLLYWRDIKQTGIVFGSFLLLLFSLTQFSVVSVVAYLALAALSATISFRIYKSVLQAVQKTDEGHPFK